MTDGSGRDWLLTQQYHNASRLTARATLHARFSTNPTRWFTWLFDRFQAPASSAVLELGCGPGWLWLSNRERIPTGWQFTLTDFSEGMLAEARQNLAFAPHAFNFAVADVQAIPYSDDSFDTVIANHMLYHAPNIPAALAEIRRVLKPGGRFYASTLAGDYMHEFELFLPRRGPAHLSFNLDNGAEFLAEQFGNVTLHRYDNMLVVTEAEPLIAYFVSMTPQSATELHERIYRDVGPLVLRYLEEHGELRLTANAGLFEAW
ncbi:MAG TPA: class I SAM-dependent methyltransferase [Ktedonobacterales bacterium]|jgi:SAM-dependent methyltransferase